MVKMSEATNLNNKIELGGADGCNNKPISAPKLTKSRQQLLNWFFTLNNYTNEEEELVKKFCATYCKRAIVGKETGMINGTPHLQGSICFFTKKDFSFIQKVFPRMHIQPTNKVDKSMAYCGKEGNIIVQIPAIKIIPKREPVKDPLEGKSLYPYQSSILELIESEPHNRKVYWFWEKEGNTGKSTLVKHIYLKKNNKVIFCSGAKKDIYCSISRHLENQENSVGIIIMDIPRTLEEKGVSYTAIEELKNGLIFSGKYESQALAFNTPHVICFANFEPDYSKLSNDRWSVQEIIFRNNINKKINKII